MTLPAAVRAGAGADIEITVWRGRGVSAARRSTVITTKITVWRGRGASTARRYTVIKGAGTASGVRHDRGVGSDVGVAASDVSVGLT